MSASRPWTSASSGISWARPRGRRRRVAAGDNELESLGGKYRLFECVLHRFGNVEQTGFGGQHALAADPVDRPPARSGDQPRAGGGRDAVARPALRRDRERLL